MKKILSITLAAFALCLFASSCVKNSELEGKVKEIVQLDSLNARMAALEAQMKQINTDLTSLKTIVDALQKNLYVTKVEKTTEGFKLTFSDGTSVEVKNGKNGKDGKDGKDAPVVGVKDSLGVYYWVLVDKTKTPPDTSWILDKELKKIPVSGKDGAEIGVKDSASVLYWVRIDKTTTPPDTSWLEDNAGKKIQAVGKDGDSMFSGIDTSKEGYVILTLAEGGTIELPYQSKFNDLFLRIQKIEVIPDYRDGSVIIANGKRTLEFIITPDSLADHFRSGNQKFTFLAFSTLTKATTFDTLAVGRFESSQHTKGLLYVLIDGSKLPSAFFHDSLAYNGFLKISDDVSCALTSSFPLTRPIYPEAPKEECFTMDFGYQRAITWAPVNCGYDTIYRYGKMYQWGRRVGLGYKDDTYSPKETEPQDGAGQWQGVNGKEDPNTFYYCSEEYENGFQNDWIANGDDSYWECKNLSSILIIMKRGTFDPCPNGWRVPTNEELEYLSKNSERRVLQDGKGIYSGMKGRYLDGKNENPESGVFLPAAGFYKHNKCTATRRSEEGRYWSNNVKSFNAYHLYFDADHSPRCNYSDGERAYGYSVRCVLD